MSKKYRIATIILNYNSSADCLKCIGYLKLQQDVEQEIVVVDNCSREYDRLAVEQAERFFQLRLRSDHAFRRFHVQFSRRGELDGRFAAHKDGIAQLRFNLAHGLGERGLGDAQRLGGGSEAALANDGEDHAGMAGIHGDALLA